MDLLVRAGQLEARIQECERLATEKEAEARALRQERAARKAELSELQLAINQAVSQQKTADATAAAQAAQAAAEKARAEAEATTAEMRKQLAALGELIAKQAEAKPAG